MLEESEMLEQTTAKKKGSLGEMISPDQRSMEKHSAHSEHESQLFVIPSMAVQIPSMRNRLISSILLYD